MQIITVGRDPENDIVLEDKKVSAKHLALNLNESGAYYVQDLGSTNGTLVNNIAIGSTPQKITPGDQVKIGDTVLPWLEYFLEQKTTISEIQEENTESSETQNTSNSLKELQQSRRFKDFIQKNKILGVGVVLLLIIFIGLLVIWYVNNVVAPELG